MARIFITGSADGLGLMVGRYLADQSHKEAALAEFSRAVELKPDSAATHYNRGRVLGDLQRYAEARAELLKACQLGPDLADAFYQLGMIERQLLHDAEASVAFKRAVELNPQDANAQFLLGQSLLKLNKSAEAVPVLKKTIEIDPSFSQAYYALFRALAKTNPEESKAYQAKFEALQLQKGVVEHAQALSNFALAAAKSGDWNRAIAQLGEAIQVCGNCDLISVLHRNLGLIDCQAGRLDDGERELRIALRTLSNDPDVLRALQTIQDLRAKSARKTP